MRTAAALIIALLLCFALPGCNTAKKATKKAEAHEQIAATFDQTTKGTETGAAFLDQETLEQIIQRYNIVVNFERWDFDTSGHEGTATDSLPMSAALIEQGSRRDKPPDVSRPKSFTKGTVTINAEGSQNRATQTSAGAQVEKTDSTQTAAAVEKTADRKEQSTEQKTTRSLAGLYVLLLIIAFAGLYFFLQKISRRL